MSCIVLQNIHHSFSSSRRNVEALRDVSFEVPKGKVVTLIGGSGCGKTTLLRIIGGVLKPTSGRVLIEEQEVTRPHEKISVVFQDFRLMPWRTARKNVELPLELSGASEKIRRESSTRLLTTIGLDAALDRYPHELSGGMKQRVGLARALITAPEILLMDEPFGALDAQTRELLQIELLHLWQESTPRKSVVFVTHSVDEAVLLSDEIIVLSSRPGRVKERIPIDLPIPRWTEELKELKSFREYRHHIWRSLFEEITSNTEDSAPNPC